MLDVMDELQHAVPEAVLSLYVDDGTVELEGTKRQVQEGLKDATRHLANGVADIGLELSATKSRVLATCSRVARNVAKASKVGGPRLLRPARHAKMLGSGTAAGSRRCTVVLQQRLKAVRAKIPRVRLLRRAGVDSAAWQRVAGNAAMSYGTDTMGVSDTFLGQQRSAAMAAACAAGGGKQKDLALWYADARGQTTDPAFAAHELPFAALAKAAWEAWWDAPPARRGLQAGSDGVRGLSRALAVAVRKLQGRDSPWAAVTGPFTAVAATAQRLGWTYDGGLRFGTDARERVDLALDSPQAVKLQVRHSVRRWRARRISDLIPGLELSASGLITDGVRKASKPPPPKHPRAAFWAKGCASALRSAVSGGQWPQVRLKSAGLAQDDLCQLCQQAKGTLAHRAVCAATAQARGDARLPAELEEAHSGLTAARQHILLTRGLLAAPDLSSCPPSATDTLTWVVRPEGGTLCSAWTVYLDGSLLDGP